MSRLSGGARPRHDPGAKAGLVWRLMFALRTLSNTNRQASLYFWVRTLIFKFNGALCKTRFPRFESLVGILLCG